MEFDDNLLYIICTLAFIAVFFIFFIYFKSKSSKNIKKEYKCDGDKCILLRCTK